jgi:formylmethanofuran dehydrogenase subunit B
MEYANTATLPDFGTIGDPGLNDFSTFTGAAIWLTSTVTNTNFAIGNIWAHNPPTTADVIASSPCVVYWGTNTNTQKLP